MNKHTKYMCMLKCLNRKWIFKTKIDGECKLQEINVMKSTIYLLKEILLVFNPKYLYFLNFLLQSYNSSGPLYNGGVKDKID